MGGDVFFIHPRPGFNEKAIQVFKFRTMNDKRDANGNLLPAMQRVTGLGAFLRRSSLDELPQLINVLKGEISFIGPRPLEMRYLPIYTAEQRRRHQVKPGITGWAQVNGRNSIGWEDKFRFDLEYVDKVSFLFDCQIFFMTIWKVLSREGVNADSNNTVIPFDQYMEGK
jgi:lipopolysaccharide/colanic/teichoic acid biosynthesis glycosyltransferase